MKNQAAKTPSMRSPLCLVRTMSGRTLYVATDLTIIVVVTAEVLENQRLKILNFLDKASTPKALNEDLNSFICSLQGNVWLPGQRFTPHQSPIPNSNGRHLHSALSQQIDKTRWEMGLAAGVFRSLSGVKYNFEQVTILLGA